MIATSIMQGGPRPCFLTPCLVQYLRGTPVGDLRPTVEDLCDEDQLIKESLIKVRVCRCKI